jgi:hypothetical protein
MTQIIEFKWTDSLENLLKSIGERCSCYSILHRNSEMKFSKYNNYLALPTSILSTITGALSIGSDSIFGPNEHASIYIGMISLFTGIISTINSYYGYAKRSENHRLVSIQYNKLFNFINLELSLNRNERMNAKNMLKIIRLEIERLIETSPPIPKQIIDDFNTKYKDENHVEKPPETNGLIEIKPNREETKGKTFNEILGLLDNNHTPTQLLSPLSPNISLSINKQEALHSPTSSSLPT